MRKALTAGCRNMLGPLDPTVEARIARFLDKPSKNTWDNVHAIIISTAPGKPRTVWQAVAAIDPSYRDIVKAHGKGARAADKWERHPDAFTVARAIRSVCGRPGLAGGRGGPRRRRRR